MGLASWIFAACAVAGAGDGDSAEQVAAAVDHALQQWRDEAEPQPEALAARLIELGPKAAPHVAEILAREDAPEDIHVPPLALALALGHAGDKASVDALRGLAASHDEEREAAALRGLAEVHSGENVALLVLGLESESSQVSQAAFDALSTWIERNPVLAWDSKLDRRLSESKQLSCAARLLGKLDTPAARAVLRKMVTSPGSTLPLAALDGYFDGGDFRERDILRELLRPTADPDVRRKACLVLGRLEDADSIPDLIDALSDEDAGFVSNARWALEEITGEHLAADPALWSEWWTGIGRETLAKLTRPHLPKVVEQRALRTLEGLLRAGVDEAVASARIGVQFSADDATVSAWLDAIKAAQARDAANALAKAGGGGLADAAPAIPFARAVPVKSKEPIVVAAATPDSSSNLWTGLLIAASAAAVTAAGTVLQRRRTRRRLATSRGPRVTAQASTFTEFLAESLRLLRVKGPRDSQGRRR